MHKHFLLLLVFFGFNLNVKSQVPIKGANGLMGYRDTISGKWLIPAKYKSAGIFSKSGLAFVCLNKSTCGCINKSGKVIVPFIYKYDEDYLLQNSYIYNQQENIPRFNDSGILIVCKTVSINGQKINAYGLINSKGKLILPVKYYISKYKLESNYFEIRDVYTDKYGIVDLRGNITVPTEYFRLYVVSNEKYLNAMYKKSDGTIQSGLIDFKNKIILPFQYNQLMYYESHNLFIVTKDSFYGVINSESLETVLNFEYQYINFVNGPNFYPVFYLLKNGKVGFSDTKGKMLTEMVYDPEKNKAHFPTLQPGHIVLKKQGKYGVLNKDGSTLIPFIYDAILYPPGYAYIYTVIKGGQYGYINIGGKIISECIYDSAVIFEGNMGLVKKNNLWACIDTNGILSQPFKYKYLAHLNPFNFNFQNNGYLIFSNDSLLGLINGNGLIISEPKFQKIQYYNHYDTVYFIVKMNDLYGIVDNQMNTIIPIRFDSIHSDFHSFIRYPGGFIFTDSTGNYYINWQSKLLYKVPE